MRKIIQTNELSSEQKSSLLTRTISALVLAALVFPCIFLGGWFYFVLTAMIAIMASYEVANVTKLPKGKLRTSVFIITIVSILLLIYYIFIKKLVIESRNGTLDSSVFLYKGFDSIQLSSLLLMLIAAVYFFVFFCTEKFPFRLSVYFIAMVIVIPLGLQSFLFLRYVPFTDTLGFGNTSVDIASNNFKFIQSTLLVFYVLIGTFMNDIGAYLTGMLFGKHKVNPRISPKKTWEGFVGGIIVSLIFSFIWAFSFSLAKLPILPMFDTNHWYWIILISILMPLLGNIGDFVFSGLKRNFEVKDFSRLIPGHGGLLDRIDSLIFASALTAGMISFIGFIGVV